LSTDARLHCDRFPRASKYHPDWLIAGASGGANALWLTEWLSEELELKPGMRVLDVGCGRAASSIFLHREFGVQVWSADLWFDPSENLRRIRDAAADSGVFPLRANARQLPFAADFFDAIVSIDSFFYFGTDDNYLSHLLRFVKVGGQLGIAGASILTEIDGAIPPHLAEWWNQDKPWFLHSPQWWRRHWEKTDLIDIEVADAMPEGSERWLQWQRVICPENHLELATVEADQGRNIGYARVIGRRRPGEVFDITDHTMPANYVKASLLRE
jgi:SAM-dependent methyltransferase